MKTKGVLTLMAVLLAMTATAQSQTVKRLHSQYEGAFHLFFYKNSLRMLDVGEIPSFNELVKNIDKAKWLSIDKSKHAFTKENLKKVTNEYLEETFETLLKFRQDGTDLHVMIKEVDGEAEGLALLVDEKTRFSVLDVVGSASVEQIVALYQAVKQPNSSIHKNK